MKESAYLQKIYAVGAKIYEPVIDKLFSFDRQGVINELLEPHGEQKVLEIGVGTGLNLPFYPKKTQIHGVDFTAHMLKKVKQEDKHKNVFLYRTDAGELPFQDNSFDAALTTYVIRVAPNPVAILREVSRCVKKDGLFVLYDQFSHGNKKIDRFEHFFKVPLGWGRNYVVEDLIEQTPWTIVKNIKMGGRISRLFNNRLLVLQNKG